MTVKYHGPAHFTAMGHRIFWISGVLLAHCREIAAKPAKHLEDMNWPIGGMGIAMMSG